MWTPRIKLRLAGLEARPLPTEPPQWATVVLNLISTKLSFFFFVLTSMFFYEPLTPFLQTCILQGAVFFRHQFSICSYLSTRGVLCRAMTQLRFNLKWNPQWTIATIIFLPRFLQANPAYCFHECHRELSWYWDGLSNLQTLYTLQSFSL